MQSARHGDVDEDEINRQDEVEWKSGRRSDTDDECTVLPKIPGEIWAQAKVLGYQNLMESSVKEEMCWTNWRV
jgi:hypothetical protein